jgi:iron complex transport system ATP-binding protein
MGRPEEVLTEDNLQKIYGVKVKVFQEYRAVVLDNFL